MRTGYQDIKDEVLRRIRSNIWPPGASLPGEVALAEEFDCARATVSRAMRELETEGVLERKRKAGTRVRAAPARRAQFAIPLIREEIAATGAAYRYGLVDRHVTDAPGWLRARIELAPSDRVLHLRCMHYADNRPYQYEERWVNLTAVPEAETFDFAEVGPNEWLVQQVPFTDGDLVFSAARATADVADFLNVAEADAVFLIERTTWLEDVSVTYARLHFPGNYRISSRF